ncbi:hypothetical protein ES702_01965 [subsurface metagenome]
MSAQKKDLSGIMMTFLFMVVGLALTPTVQEQVTNITGVGGDNLTGAALAIAKLIPLFWVIIVIAIGLAAIVTWLKV